MPYKAIRYVLILILFLSFLFSFSYANDKKILGLYKSNENATSSNNPVQNYLSAPLNEMGFNVDYKDALGSLPCEEEMKKYDAVITFFFTPIHPNPVEYIEWLTNQIINGKKVVIIGNFGAHTSDEKKWVTSEMLNEFFLPFGLSFKGTKKVLPDNIKLITDNSGVFDKTNLIPPEYYSIFQSVNNENKIFVKTEIINEMDSSSCPVVKTPYGGMAALGYLYTQDSLGKVLWNLNIKKFLKDVLEFKSFQSQGLKVLLALYKGSENQTYDENILRKYAAEPLLKLGYRVVYRDIEKGIPSDDEMENYSGIITWFLGGQMYGASQYCQWLPDQLNNDKKIIILGSFGAFADKIKKDNHEFVRFLSPIELNNFFYPFGLIMNGNWTDKPELIKCVYLNPEIINKTEFSDPSKFKNYYLFRSINPANQEYLTLERTDINKSKSAVVVKTPYGTMAIAGYIYYQNPNTWETKFMLNLAEFFKNALEKSDFIKPEIYDVQVDPQKEIENESQIIEKSPAFLPDSSPRKVLVLFKGSENESFNVSPFYINSGPILNYLGLSVEYIDIEKTIPDENAMKQYIGIITWFFNEGMFGAEDYNKWLLKQLENGKKLVVLGNFGAFYDLKTYKISPTSQMVFDKLGILLDDEYLAVMNNLKALKNELLTSRDYGTFEQNPISFESGRPSLYSIIFNEANVIKKDNSFFGFEAPLKTTPNSSVSPVKSINSANKVILSVESSRAGELDPAIIGNWGGLLMGDFFYEETFLKNKSLPINTYEDLLGQKLNDDTITTSKDNGNWVVNPFLFFNSALGIKDMPRPDYSTLNGQRILYIHVDADGFSNISQIDPNKYSSEIINEEIFKKYNLPISASIITEEMVENGSKYYNMPLKIAREISALDNIEVATHTHTHPFNLTDGDLQLEFKEKSNNSDYNIEFIKPDPKTEILYSAALIDQNITTNGKKCKMVFWPGMCNPTADFIKEADALKLNNINGGDPIYDSSHNSYSNLCPIFTKIGDYLQVHTSSSNEYIYTNSWTGDYGGLKKLIEHIKYTEKNIIIYPINIYFHYNSGTYSESLSALKEVVEYCMGKTVAPLFASQYTSIVKDFYDTVIERTSDGGFIVKNTGYLRTIRFDDCTLYPDPKKSENILGFTHINNSLYIFLDEKNEHKIYLTKDPYKDVYLKSASHYINNWNYSQNTISAEIEGIGQGYLQVANLKADSIFEVSISDDNKEIKTDNNGFLEYRYELKGQPKKYKLEIKLKK